MLPRDPSVEDFLAQSFVAHVATVSASGRPFVTPLWFVVDDGMLYLTTGFGTRAAKNVANHPEVAVLFTGERRARRGEALRVRGTATRHAGLPSWRVLLRVAAKYYASPRAATVELANAGKWALRARFYAQGKGGAGHLRIEPISAEILPTPT